MHLVSKFINWRRPSQFVLRAAHLRDQMYKICQTVLLDTLSIKNTECIIITRSSRQRWTPPLSDGYFAGASLGHPLQSCLFISQNNVFVGSAYSKNVWLHYEQIASVAVQASLRGVLCKWSPLQSCLFITQNNVFVGYTLSTNVWLNFKWRIITATAVQAFVRGVLCRWSPL